MKGNHAVCRSNRCFGRVWTDMALEQSINLDFKKRRGIMGIIQKQEALDRWFLMIHEWAAITSATKEMGAVQTVPSHISVSPSSTSYQGWWCQHMWTAHLVAAKDIGREQLIAFTTTQLNTHKSQQFPLNSTCDIEIAESQSETEIDFYYQIVTHWSSKIACLQWNWITINFNYMQVLINR